MWLPREGQGGPELRTEAGSCRRQAEQGGSEEGTREAEEPAVLCQQRARVSPERWGG